MAIEVKQGDTLQIDCTWWADAAETTPLDLTGWTLAAWARHSTGQVEVLTVLIVDAVAGKFSVTATPAQTAAWPIGDWMFDVERNRGGVVLSSDTIDLKVLEDITNG